MVFSNFADLRKVYVANTTCGILCSDKRSAFAGWKYLAYVLKALLALVSIFGFVKILVFVMHRSRVEKYRGSQNVSNLYFELSVTLKYTKVGSHCSQF